ncbi:MAG: bifunctional 4-hydroxy-2-oxoglutarate aldolase/2-dehydro-3-deoxy-phosphogluconate aldolase [Candidatus Lokiarchaeota archaeon]|nr:bifunctional 4-hydroxy-2-oxoglutarate aldolase/2-dehydro-3-deoxy-phosphogluconate aldolase [Candidatus Lokiarchaeota archaeon]MBD3201836.1 bifunctional 4-hydroxy-2-oxoglutarate aldolase/2-dehydro-3-deoxy-phosphogluconate aldolase [Candidatus Lokiarchaeota archaeon]
MDVYKQLEKHNIVPVVVIEDEERAIPLASTLLDAGLPIVEITFRTKAAAAAISNIRKEFPKMVVGAGTVLTIEQVKAAVNTGSMFLVTPGFNPTVVDYCVDNNIEICPGLNIPSFVEWGLERGLNHFKFYPADQSGGPRMLKLLSGPYPTVKFMPTGGINNETLIEYLRLDNVFACGGSWIVKKDLISAGNFDEIKKRVETAVSLVDSEIN